MSPKLHKEGLVLDLGKGNYYFMSSAVNGGFDFSAVAQWQSIRLLTEGL
jgi:hypothetical protein